MFEIGSYVIYRAEGVCKISDIRKESFGALGGQDTYYILSPMNDEKSTVYVPFSNEVLLGMMRPLMSAEEICRMVAEKREERMEWIEDSRARNARLREILSHGDRLELVVMANTLIERSEIAAQKNSGVKKLTGSDEALLKRACKMLYEEFSVTSVIDSEEQIHALLRGELTLASR